MKLPFWLLSGALLGALTVGLWLHGLREQERGAWKAERTALQARIDSVGRVTRTADSVYVADSTAFRLYAARYYRLRDSLRSIHTVDDKHPRKSVAVPDSGASVPVGGTLLGLCDSTVTLAEQALASCAARVRAGDSLLAATNARLTHEQRKPGPRRFPSVTVGGVLGSDGKVRLGIGVGIRIF